MTLGSGKPVFGDSCATFQLCVLRHSALPLSSPGALDFKPA